MLPLEAVFCPCCGAALLHSLVLQHDSLLIQRGSLALKRNSQRLGRNKLALRPILTPWSSPLQTGGAGAATPPAHAPRADHPLPARQPQDQGPD